MFYLRNWATRARLTDDCCLYAGSKGAQASFAERALTTALSFLLLSDDIHGVDDIDAHTYAHTCDRSVLLMRRNESHHDDHYVLPANHVHTKYMTSSLCFVM